MSKQEKIKYIIIGIAPVILYAFLAFVFLFIIPAFSGEKEELDIENNPFAAINTGMPEIAGEGIYNSKSEAYDNAKDTTLRIDNFSFDRIKSFTEDSDSSEHKNGDFTNIQTHIPGTDTTKAKKNKNKDKFIQALAMFQEEERNEGEKRIMKEVPKHTASQQTALVEKTVPTIQSPVIVEKKTRRKSRSLSNNNNNNNNRVTGKTQTKSKGFVEAVISESKTVINGSKIKLRVIEDIIYNDIKIDKNSYLYGIVSLTRNRVRINIGSFKKNRKIIPLAFTVYDTDGFEGIYIPEGIRGEIAQESIGEGLKTADDAIPSGTVGDIGSAVASIVRKGQREKRAFIPVNYKIFLKW
jgi:hypothetical protein